MLYKFANVIIASYSKEVDKEFLYVIPEIMALSAAVGMRVIVPFGIGNKPTEGFITGLLNETSIPQGKIKTILELASDKPLFNNELLTLAQWMRVKYYTTLYACLKCIMPAGLGFEEDSLIMLNNEANEAAFSAKQKTVLLFIKENGGKLLRSELVNEFGKSVQTILKSLNEKNLITISDASQIKDLSVKVKYVYLNYDNESLEELTGQILNDNQASKKAQAAVITALMQNDGISLTDLKSYLHISDSPVKTLESKAIVKTEFHEVLRNTVYYDKQKKEGYIRTLTKNQSQVVSFIKNKQDNKPVLIHGVTGSGKTEIYLNLIDNVIKKGRQAIVLVPEISLTPQTVDIFLQRFGGLVSVSHSKQTLGERYDQWKKARDGKISIMIGPRSAVFTPFSDLGIIIIDEEHENTYKSETTPKYYAKEVAIKRGQLTGALVVLGSATPSIESYHEATTGIFDLQTISERINKRFPDIEVVDMRYELANGNKSIFSAALIDAISKNITDGKQTILFLNRRGHSTFVSCRRCGQAMVCDSCNVNYTYHKYSDKLLCHYCGRQIKNPENCPVCGSKFIKYFGIGTQRIEQEVMELFPGTPVLRMDSDTTTSKNSHEKMLASFRAGSYNILIGTQMIAKGLDFPNVTVVGVVAADTSLNNGDFRSAESTFQLLTQVSGRAGRAHMHGKVFIQTYTPEHYSIKYVKEMDYKQFYDHEIAIRRQMLYPPYTKIFCILFTGTSEKKIIIVLFKLLDIMKYYNRKSQFEMVGPAPAFISKINLKYRYKLIVKSVDEEKLKNFVFYCLDKLKGIEDLSDININVTLNPISLV